MTQPDERFAVAGPSENSASVSKIVMVASIAAGVQFGWALQLSLLTPYVQLLGVPHALSSFIWLCGPISGMVVQPIVGYQSDQCKSSFGRRRPFIAAGIVFVALAVAFIGFAADIGYRTGDSLTRPIKPRAVVLFIVGFWILDVANNMLQGPCRAFLADLSGGSQKKMRTANALFSFFMGVGNILGYSAGSYTKLYKIFPFSKTTACDVYCANLKSCFIISITLLLVLGAAALSYVKETPRSYDDEPGDEESHARSAFSWLTELALAFKSMKKPMWVLLLVTCLNWVGWFPFLLFDTDWMGKEVYGGNPSKRNSSELRLYDLGVRAGALGLLLNSVVLGVTSLGIETFARWAGGAKRLWGAVNFLLAICLAMIVLISKLAESHRHSLATIGGEHPQLPPMNLRIGAMAIFAVLGVPLAVTFSIPFALASIFSSSSGSGQGLSLGVLNLSIVIPQMFVSLLSGPFDKLFGGGNLPAFVVGAVAALISGILALTFLPSPPPEAKTSQSTIIMQSH